MPCLLFSHSVVSNSLQPYRLQHSRFPCCSPSPRALSRSCPLNWWCHPTISSSVVPLSSCLQSCPASRYFLMSQLSASGGQCIRVSASGLVLPMYIQGWFPLKLTGLISLHSKSLLQTHSSRASVLRCSAFFMFQLSHPYVTTVKSIALLHGPLSAK